MDDQRRRGDRAEQRCPVAGRGDRGGLAGDALGREAAGDRALGLIALCVGVEVRAGDQAERLDRLLDRGVECRRRPAAELADERRGDATVLPVTVPSIYAWNASGNCLTSLKQKKTS